MGFNDARFSDNVYLTSDIAFASYLLMRGFTLLGAIDNDHPRKEFGLYQPEDVEDLSSLIDALQLEYDAHQYREFFMNIKTLRRSLDNPVRREP
jgi:hypothetical protein